MAASVIPGLIFGLIGLYIIYWFSRNIIGQLFGSVNFADFQSKRILRKSQLALDQAVSEFDDGKLEVALERLKGAFIFSTGIFPYSTISMITSQHLSILNFLLDVAEKKAIRLEDLPILEELIQVRGGILKAYSDTSASVKKLKNNRSAKTPEWAKDEFKAKQKELIDKLEDNREVIKKIYVKIGTTLIGDSTAHEYH